MHKHIIRHHNFDEFQSVIRTVLPNWYNEIVHLKLCTILETEGKLNACKYLVDLSKLHDTFGSEFGLTWAKREICDLISPLELSLPPEELFSLRAEQFNRATIQLVEAWENIPNKENFKFAIETIVSCNTYIQKYTTKK